MKLLFGKKRINYKNNIVVLTLIVVYRLLLDYCYFIIIAPNYSYQGLIDAHTSISLLLSWACLLLSFFFIRKIITNINCNASNWIVLSLYMVSFVPFTTCIFSGFITINYLLYNELFWIMLLAAQGYAQKKIVRGFNSYKLGSFTIDDKAALFIGAISFLLVFFISAYYTHFRLNFNLFSVYSLRAEAKTYNLPTVIVYAFSWSRAINPIMLGYCINRRKTTGAILFFFAQMLSFGIDGLKSTFFMPFIVLICLFLSKKINIRKVSFYLIEGFSAIVFIGIVENVLLKSSYVINIFIRRMMFLTNYIGLCYYDFFQKNTPDYFRSSLLRFFGVSGPYSENGGITYMIGRIYSNTGASNYNNGLSSDAITNFGNIGFIVMPILLIIVLRMIDKSTLNLNSGIILSVVAYATEVFIGSFLTTALLTHGILILIVLLNYLNRNKEIRDKRLNSH